MGDEVEMGISDSGDDLSEEEPGLLLGDIVILNVIVELAAVGQFHDDEDVVGGIEYLVKLDDVLVADELEDLNLALDLSGRGGTLEMRFLFFILRLFMILMATFTPVRSCFASEEPSTYPSPSRTPPSRSYGPGCNAQCELPP
jgi:hypothetical protein